MVEGLFSVGQKCSDFGQFFNVVNDQILKKNITHLVTPERKKFECVILAEIAYQGMETVWPDSYIIFQYLVISNNEN